MSKPVIRIHNSQTNEIIDREMTTEEFKIYKADQEAELVKQAEAEAKTIQRQDILDRLGLTSEEASLLLS